MVFLDTVSNNKTAIVTVPVFSLLSIRTAVLQVYKIKSAHLGCQVNCCVTFTQYKTVPVRDVFACVCSADVVCPVQQLAASSDSAVQFWLML